MRDEQVRRYARHILLPDMGGLGQTALLAATARLAIDREPSAARIAASYLAAGGVGALVLTGATDAQLAVLAAHGPDTKIICADRDGDRSPGAGAIDGDAPDDRTLAIGNAGDCAIPAAPAWWPATTGDATALAFWRGALAATSWMARVANH